MSVGATTFRGWPAVELRAGPRSRAIVLHYGAQVVSWIVDGRERLWLSPTADFREGVHVRGGVPVSFPQFDRLGPLQRHGFARLRDWTRAAIDADGTQRSGGMGGARDAGTADRTEGTRDAIGAFDGFAATDPGDTADVDDANDACAIAGFALHDDDRTRGSWPFAFGLALTVRLERDALDVMLTVRNEDRRSFAFTAALHTYLRVRDDRRAAVHGLGAVAHRDHRTGVHGCDEAGTALCVAPIGRTYPNRGQRVEFDDGAGRVAIGTGGFGDIVVWNPGPDMPFPDLPAEGWRDFMCVEAAQASRALALAPGAAWSGGQRLAVMPASA